MDEMRDGLVSGRHNQKQREQASRAVRHAGGMTTRERRYLRERRRARTHQRLLADSGSGRLRVAVLRPLLSETMTLEVEASWHVLFPDAQPEEMADAEMSAADVLEIVDVEAVEDLDVTDDADDADGATR